MCSRVPVKTSIEFIRAAFFLNANLIKVTTYLSGASRSRVHEDHLGMAAEPGPCRTGGCQRGRPVRGKELWPVNNPGSTQWLIPRSQAKNT